jgi:Outer membrane cobalamin receptor protein
MIIKRNTARQWEEDIALCDGETEAEMALSYWLEESKKLSEVVQTQQREIMSLEALITKISRISRMEDRAGHWKAWDIKELLREAGKYEETRRGG